LKHVDEIRRLIKVLLASDRFHVLIIQGPPGWAKTHTTREVLTELKVPYDLLGAYSTPLAMFNKMAENPSGKIVIDDSAGIFYNPLALSVLNSASWPGAGSSSSRHVKWSSTTERASCESFDFLGKLIILTNSLPESPQVNALLNRALPYRISITGDEVGDALIAAASNASHLDNKDRALMVAEFLKEKSKVFDAEKISLRTLEQGYELASVDNDGWRDLLMSLLPKQNSKKMTDEEIIHQLVNSGLKVEEQVHRFCQCTGKSRRTFFNLKGRILPETEVRQSMPKLRRGLRDVDEVLTNGP